MQLQADMEFKKKNDIKELNKKFNVETFSTKTRGGKTFAAEQKIRELKKRISKLNLIKSKGITPLNLIKKSTKNMNKTESGKYGLSPKHIKKQFLISKKFRLSFNFDRLKKSKQVSKALDKYDKSFYSGKEKET